VTADHVDEALRLVALGADELSQAVETRILRMAQVHATLAVAERLDELLGLLEERGRVPYDQDNA
jgi:hypothetical protein